MKTENNKKKVFMLHKYDWFITNAIWSNKRPWEEEGAQPSNIIQF